MGVLWEVTLSYKDARSDKVYQCGVHEVAGGFTVPFAFGRRGTTLQTGTKTAQPCPSVAHAKAVYDKLVAEKLGKGYQVVPPPSWAGAPKSSGGTRTPTVSHTAMTNAPAKELTGLLPQLLNEIEEAQLEALLTDPAYCAQEKHDGKRMMLSYKGGKLVANNRKGQACGYPDVWKAEIAKVSVDCVFDGEAIGDTFWAFDSLFYGKEIGHLGYEDRHATLGMLVSGLSMTKIKMVETAFTEAEKRALLARIKSEDREGIVFKRLDAPYKPGRPESGGDQLKYKLTATCTCRVSKPHATKRSMALELLSQDTGEWINVGNCTVSVNKEIPVAGTLVEVRYLYAYKGGSLYQPFFVGVRDDLEDSECVLSQLKYKPEGASDDDAEAMF